METKYHNKQKQIEDINEENALIYNQELYKKIHKSTGYDPLTKELMKIVLNELILNLNRSIVANKKMFFIKCLELIKK